VTVPPRTFPDRSARCALLLVALLGLTLEGRQQQQSPAQQPQPPPRFRVEANYVRVDVYPTQGGLPVTDLTAADFELLEDGTPQKIEAFEHVVVRPAGPQETRVEPDSQRQANQMAEDPRARIFVIFLDTYHVTVTSSHNIRKPLISLMDQIIGPDDLIGFMTPEMSAANLTLGRKTQVLEGALTDNWVWGKRFQIIEKDVKEEEYEACYKTGFKDGEEVAREMIARRRERLTLEAVRDLVVHLRGLREERKAVIAVSEGWLQFRENAGLAKPLQPVNPYVDPVVPGKPEIFVGPDGKLRAGGDPRLQGQVGSLYDCDADRQRLAFMDNERYFREILDDANRANASFYPVDPRGLPVFDTPMGPDKPPPVNVDRVMLKTRQESLQTLAVATDGMAVMNTNDIERGLKRVAADLTSYYLLGYYSTNAKLDGKFRSIKVRVKRPGVQVRARRGYRAATMEEVTAARSGASEPGSADGNGPGSGASTTATINNALGRLALLRPNVSLYLHAVTMRDGAGLRILVVGELDGSVARTPTWAKGGEATVMASGAEGTAGSAKATIAAGTRSFVVSMPIAASAAGAMNVQGRVRPLAESALPLTAAASVPAPVDGAFLADSPLLFTVRGNAAPSPVASFRIFRTERLRLEVPLAETAKPRDARLLDRAGKPLGVTVAVSERTDAGSRWLVADLNPAPLGAGDYIVELSAERDGRRDVVVTAIRIAQ
jgi:VWFA-related protein